MVDRRWAEPVPSRGVEDRVGPSRTQPNSPENYGPESKDLTVSDNRRVPTFFVGCVKRKKVRFFLGGTSEVSGTGPRLTFKDGGLNSQIVPLKTSIPETIGSLTQ